MRIGVVGVAFVIAKVISIAISIVIIAEVISAVTAASVTVFEVAVSAAKAADASWASRVRLVT